MSSPHFSPGIDNAYGIVIIIKISISKFSHRETQDPSVPAFLQQFTALQLPTKPP
jgi:hypothetical protein